MEKRYTDQEMVQRRLAGILPHIDVNGRDFIVDWRLRELRAADNPADRIGLKNLPIDADGRHYLCFYNTRLRTTVIPDIHMTELPKDLVLLTIPYELKLDPVAVAREMDEPDTWLLSAYPLQQDLKVKVTPIEETEMVQLVQRNRDRQRLLKNSNKSIQKRRKGKGL